MAIDVKTQYEQDRRSKSSAELAVHALFHVDISKYPAQPGTWRRW